MTVLVDYRFGPRLPIMDPGDMGRRPLVAKRKLLDMLSMLATGHLPWGVPWVHRFAYPAMPYVAEFRAYVMSCGHMIQRRRGREMIEAGLLEEREDPVEGLHVVITELGRRWLAWNWR